MGKYTKEEIMEMVYETVEQTKKDLHNMYISTTEKYNLPSKDTIFMFYTHNMMCLTSFTLNLEEKIKK